MTSALDLRERRELADLLDELGPDAPTLCEGWTTADLAAHLVIREREPLASPGILLGGALGRFTNRRMGARLASKSYPAVVDEVRTGPPMGPLRIPPVRYYANLIEYFVHHEDARRANGGPPREDRPDLDGELWRLLRRMAPLLARKVKPVGLAMRRPGGENATAAKGDPTVIIAGRPGELVLYLYGRKDAADVELDGPVDAVAAVEAASFGV